MPPLKPWFRKSPAATSDVLPTSGDTVIPVQNSRPTCSIPAEVGQVGPYRLLRLLGEGGMAKVFVAEFSSAPGTQYALKMMASTDEEDEFRMRFEREILIGLKLSHPNICRAVDWGQLPDRSFYLVMELLEGSTLADWVDENGEQPVPQTRQVLRQILVGLDVIHRNGIIHRDLKPANIFVTTEGVVKIMDFGLARSVALRPMTTAGTIFGTFEFMSPEQLRDTKYADHRTDLYNVGLVAYYMLTSRLPIEGALEEVITRLAKGRRDPIVKYRPDLPLPWVAWIERLTAQDPDERFQTAQEALAALPSG